MIFRSMTFGTFLMSGFLIFSVSCSDKAKFEGEDRRIQSKGEDAKAEKKYQDEEKDSEVDRPMLVTGTFLVSCYRDNRDNQITCTSMAGKIGWPKIKAFVKSNEKMERISFEIAPEGSGYDIIFKSLSVDFIYFQYNGTNYTVEVISREPSSETASKHENPVPAPVTAEVAPPAVPISPTPTPSPAAEAQTEIQTLASTPTPTPSPIVTPTPEPTPIIPRTLTMLINSIPLGIGNNYLTTQKNPDCTREQINLVKTSSPLPVRAFPFETAFAGKLTITVEGMCGVGDWARYGSSKLQILDNTGTVLKGLDIPPYSKGVTLSLDNVPAGSFKVKILAGGTPFTNDVYDDFLIGNIQITLVEN
ncbi:MAG: hypothetical protein HQK54_06990 [Oligoflexales bacterium]|nr:hypothetical protein [Oligoflexales bacterium]